MNRSVSIEAPKIGSEEGGNTEQVSDQETSGLQAFATKCRRIIGRSALILGLSTVPMAVGEIIQSPEAAYAADVAGYPNPNAMAYNTANYDWWEDENGDKKPYVTPSETDNDESMSSRGYAYRNCTDGVAFWTKEHLGINIPGWGNAANWNEAGAARGYTVKGGNSQAIESGDIAQSDDGNFGHVGFVTEVTKNSDGTIKNIQIAEMNMAGTGNQTLTYYSSRNALGKFIRYNTNDWDHFIDLNGANKGLDSKLAESPAPTPKKPIPGDFNGDNRSDVAVYRPGEGGWHIDGVGDFPYGKAGDIPVPADYNGDRKTDKAVYRPSEGGWHIDGVGDFPFGQNGDIPVPGDYNGDGKAEIAIYRPGDGTWHIRGIGAFQHGKPGDIPVPGYYNNDDVLDIAIFRPQNGGWYIRGVGDFPYGASTDIPVPADYNGDGITDIAVYRPSEGGWHIRGVGDFPYGNSTDVPVPGYYNNDDKADAAVYRPREGGWHQRGIRDFPYGHSTDVPAVQTLNAFLLKRYGLIQGY